MLHLLALEPCPHPLKLGLQIASIGNVDGLHVGGGHVHRRGVGGEGGGRKGGDERGWREDRRASASQGWRRGRVLRRCRLGICTPLNPSSGLVAPTSETRGAPCSFHRPSAENRRQNRVLHLLVDVELDHGLLQVGSCGLSDAGCREDSDSSGEGERTNGGVRVAEEGQEERREGTQGGEGRGMSWVADSYQVVESLWSADE